MLKSEFTFLRIYLKNIWDLPLTPVQSAVSPISSFIFHGDQIFIFPSSISIPTGKLQVKGPDTYEKISEEEKYGRAGH